MADFKNDLFRNFRAANLGTRVEDGKPFLLEHGEDPVHVLITGMTGYGKSRTLNGFITACIDQDEGVAVLEPGDLCEDVIAGFARRVNETGDKGVLKRIHYLRASPKRCFRYDLFRMPVFDSFHPELMDSVRRAWAHCKVQSVAEILQSKQGSESFEGMPRLQRVLYDILAAVAVEVRGQRLSVADAKILLDFTHEHHAAVFEKLRPKLSRDVVSDFEVMHNFRRVEDLRRETESSLNRLRSFLGPLTTQILSATGKEPAVNIYDIVQQGHCLLVPLQEDPFFSHDQKLSLGALILHDIIETLILTPREKRKNFTIVIDEAGEFLSVAGDRLTRSAGMLRKHKGRLVIAGQNLDTFRRNK